MDSPKEIAFTYGRKFGVEIELNSFDKRDFKKQPLSGDELPQGIEYVSQKLMSALGMNEEVQIKGWESTHNNTAWIVKPDSSCGIEVCSPPTKGWKGLKMLLKAVNAVANDDKIEADGRCSMHVHVDISDFNTEQLGSLLSYYVKSEMIFLDSMPPDRKKNRYCQCIGVSDVFDVDEPISTNILMDRLGSHKYFSANVWYLRRGKRNTIEFRIVGNEGCLDPFLVKNWIRLLIHFIEMTKKTDMPKAYVQGDPWSGLSWLDPEQLFMLLGFDGFNPLSAGMEQTRNWFLARLYNNMMCDLPGMWSKEARYPAQESILKIMDQIKVSPDDLKEYMRPSDAPNALFSELYKM